MSEHPDPFGPQSARFGLSGVAAAAYLEHPVLGPRLGEAIRVVMANGSVSAASVVGEPDAMKFRSCLTLFHLAAPDEPLFIEALQRYFGGRPDPDTLRLVAGAGDARRSSGPMPLRGADRLRREAQGDPMKPEQLEKWKKIRAKGMLRYVLLGGVVSYGLPMFVIMTFVVNRDRLAEGHVGISAIAWTIGGALFGLAMWFVQERQFRKAGASGNAP